MTIPEGVTPEGLARRLTLLMAVMRYDELRFRDSLARTADDMRAENPALGRVAPPLSRDEALELAALGEAIALKVAQGRQPAVRAARAAGASWAQVGSALGLSKQAAWESHSRWIDALTEARRRAGLFGPAEPTA